MPTKKPKEEKEKIAPEKAVVSPLGEYEENPVPEKSGDYVTKNGNKFTIVKRNHYDFITSTSI